MPAQPPLSVAICPPPGRALWRVGNPRNKPRQAGGAAAARSFGRHQDAAAAGRRLAGREPLTQEHQGHRGRHLGLAPERRPPPWLAAMSPGIAPDLRRLDNDCSPELGVSGLGS